MGGKAKFLAWRAEHSQKLGGLRGARFDSERLRSGVLLDGFDRSGGQPGLVRSRSPVMVPDGLDRDVRGPLAYASVSMGE